MNICTMQDLQNLRTGIFKKEEISIYSDNQKKVWDFTVCQVKSPWIYEVNILVRKVDTMLNFTWKDRDNTDWVLKDHPRRFQLIDA